MIGTLLLQYLQLFDKAKIYEIKKVKSLQKHINNYISGYLKKLQQSAQPDQARKSLLLSQSEEFVSGNLLGILVWAKAARRNSQVPPSDSKNQNGGDGAAAASSIVFIEHDEARIKWLLEKFFSGATGQEKASLGLSVNLMVQHGFQMEYRTDYLAKIAADPGCHPGFANYREDFEEEAKDGPQGKPGAKKAKKGEAMPATSKGPADNFGTSQPTSKQKGHRHDHKTDQVPQEQ